MLKQIDTLLSNIGQQGLLNGLARDILDMQHPSLAMPTLLAQRNSSITKTGKFHPHTDQVLNAFRTIL